MVRYDGVRRGAGWAGLIEVDTHESEALGRSLTSRAPVRLNHGDKELVFGPYFARAAAFVPVTNDTDSSSPPSSASTAGPAPWKGMWLNFTWVLSSSAAAARAQG